MNTNSEEWVMYARTGRRDGAVDVRYYDRHFAQLAEASGFG
jgi:hypothetical protein